MALSSSSSSPLRSSPSLKCSPPRTTTKRLHKELPCSFVGSGIAGEGMFSPRKSLGRGRDSVVINVIPFQRVNSSPPCQEHVNLISRHTGQSPEKITEDIRRPKYFKPDETVDHGIDKVLNAEGDEKRRIASDLKKAQLI